jgi:hypothetical protein
MILFKIFWAIDALCTLIMLYFLFEGLGDNTVNERNGGMWMAMVFISAAVLGGSILLRSQGYTAVASVICGLVAVPALLYGLFMLVIILSGTKWQ